MTTSYRKRGVTVRIERTSRSTSVVELAEAGEAWFDAGTFYAKESAPDRDRMPAFGSRAATQFAQKLEDSVDSSLEIERYTIAQGAAEHEVGSTRWLERNARAHVSLLDRRHKTRLLFDLGGPTFDDIDLTALALHHETPSTPITRLQLPPHVSAALWPTFLAAAADGRFERRAFRIRQRAHPDFRFDGVGTAIGDALLLDAERPGPLDAWPNYFRPSYRTPPTRSPFHVVAECEGEAVPTDSTARALASNVIIDGSRIVAELVYANAVHAISLTLSDWLRRIEWISEPKKWFPVGSGSWGADVALRVDDLTKSEYRPSSSRNRV